MKFDLAYIVSFAAILVMAYCLILTFALKKDIPGGMVGKRWNFLSALVVLFTLGYLTTPFFGQIPVKFMRILVSFIFLFGAIYVVITVKLIHSIIKELSE